MACQNVALWLDGGDETNLMEKENHNSEDQKKKKKT